jgi:lipopolysaccharide biosynthesis glycosyltransferase
MSIHCFTSFTFSYLARAKILVSTLRRAHPDWTIWAVMVDEPHEGNDFGLAEEFDKVVYAKDLGFSDFRNWLFKHDIVEASTAVKGQMLRHILQHGADKVVYLDPDIAVFSNLGGIVRRLDTHSIILTPHQVEPNESEGLMKDNELTSLKYGIYNLGFAAVKNDQLGNQFADWWARQLRFACYDEIENGLFTDQKWCDIVPALFDGVYIERDPGYNVASWNLSRRRLKISKSGEIFANDSPLKFFHFTKINTAGDIMIEKNATDNTEVMEIWNWYKRTLASNTIPSLPKGYWYYSAFENGETIPKDVRVFFRRRADLIKFFDNPFAVGDNSFYEWLRKEEPSLLMHR